MSKRLLELCRQLAIFGLVGIAATLVHFFTATAMSQFIPLAYANPVGFLAAVGVSYYGHLRFTFGISAHKSNHRSRAIKFFAVALLGFIAGQTILIVLSATGRFQPWQTLLVAVCTIPATTFLISRFWVFRQATTDHQPTD